MNRPLSYIYISNSKHNKIYLGAVHQCVSRAHLASRFSAIIDTVLCRSDIFKIRSYIPDLKISSVTPLMTPDKFFNALILLRRS